jgi:hypothetical protein
MNTCGSFEVLHPFSRVLNILFERFELEIGSAPRVVGELAINLRRCYP